MISLFELSNFYTICTVETDYYCAEWVSIEIRDFHKSGDSETESSSRSRVMTELFIYINLPYSIPKTLVDQRSIWRGK